MARTSRFGLMALVVVFLLGLASAAAAYEKDLSAGDPKWVLENLNADAANMAMLSLDGGWGKVMVTVTFVKDQEKTQATYPVNCWGTSPATPRAQKPGWLVERLEFECTRGKVKVAVNLSGRSY